MAFHQVLFPGYTNISFHEMRCWSDCNSQSLCQSKWVIKIRAMNRNVKISISLLPTFRVKFSMTVDETFILLVMKHASIIFLFPVQNVAIEEMKREALMMNTLKVRLQGKKFWQRNLFVFSLIFIFRAKLQLNSRFLFTKFLSCWHQWQLKQPAT